ncbi:LPXTG cell wall anchor domain-containing protein [Streptomyces pratensis]|uniref:LPXTG cell wall anchor domain-containing protein n=1 Tax=Streptomyces pratensis TaxID=1169025 RepID=UPI003018F369
MKLRRAMAAAAATAVLAPVTLLSSSVAFATPSPAPETTETTETPEAAVPEESETSPAAEEPEAPASEEASPTPPTAENGEPSPAAEQPETAPSPAGTVTAPSPTPSAASPADICEGTEEPEFDKNLRTTLSGLPSEVVAGSGFHGFRLNVVNKGDNAYQRVDLGVFAAQVDTDTWEETTGHLTLQFKDPETGVWTDISLADEETAGYLGYTDIRAQESFAIDMRLSVGAKAPAGFGFAITIGLYADDKGNCVFADSEEFYVFDVLAADADPGKPNEAEPQEGGRKPLPAKPVGDTEVKPEGTLAQTGSDSGLPVIATIGGVAVLAGAGVVFALGRRRRGHTAA